MKPNRIFLIRHGESVGNVDRSLYATIPDYAITLTEQGKLQAIDAGKRLKEIIKDERIQFYVSSYFRTRQTFHGINESIQVINHKEDPRLREQEWAGRLNTLAWSPEAQMIQEAERDAYGSFYYRFEGGESCADVYDRMSTFLDTLHRDFQKEEYPENAGVISHGMAVRVLIMRWLHLTVEEFELMANPKNCDIIMLEKDPNDKYHIYQTGELIERKLVVPLTKYDSPKHPYRLG